MYHLIVKHPFGIYPVGYRIEDPALVERILAGPNEHSVLRILAPVGFVPPAPEPVAAPVAYAPSSYESHE